MIAQWYTWPEVRDMSLDEVDLNELLLYAVETAKPAQDETVVVE